MKYQLKNGRIVNEGDYVEVKLTPRMIKYFEELHLLTPYEDDNYDFVKELFNLFK